MSASRRRSHPCLLLSWAFAAFTVPAFAGDNLAVYTMNDRGLLSVGGTVLEKLKSGFDPSEDPVVKPEQQWVDLEVVGSDRWTLRRDGRIEENGSKLRVLPFDITTNATWLQLARSDALYALRSDGMLAQDDLTDVTYPPYNFAFLDLVAPPVDPFLNGPDVFALRSDGGVFGSTTTTPGIVLVGGPGVRNSAGTPGSPDGEFFDTVWVACAVDPSTDEIYALRADGRVHSFDWEDFDASSGVDPAAPPPPPGGGIGPPAGVEQANLPFPDTLLFTLGDLYIDIAFDEDGTWYVLRQDGAVFRSDDDVNPLVLLPGDGIDPEKTFVDLAVLGGVVRVLRYDGSLYDETGALLLNLQKKRYLNICLSEDPPDLSNFKNRKPVTSVYKPIVLENQALTLPIIVADVDKLSEDLDVLVDLSLLPGASYDPITRVVSWPGGPAGKYRITVSADDGLLKKPKKSKYSVRVVPADTVPEKNRPPNVTKVKKVLALVGIESTVPLLAIDRDGDTLTFSVDNQAGIFARGAIFDANTATITWTPAFDDVGKWKAVVFVSDGTKTKKLKLKFEVASPLIF